MTFSKKDADDTYAKPDPWGFRTNAADAERKRRIIETINDLYDFGPGRDGEPPFRILDIACGEGFITEGLEAEEGVYGYELSDKARGRWAKQIKQFKPGSAAADKMRFDVILITGALYPEYDWRSIVGIALKYLARGPGTATAYVVVSHIADREYAEAIEALQESGNLWQRKVQEFPYIRSENDQFMQRLRVFETASEK